MNPQYAAMMQGLFNRGGSSGGMGGLSLPSDYVTSAASVTQDLSLKKFTTEGSRAFNNAPIFGANPFITGAGISGINWTLILLAAMGAGVLWFVFKR